MSEGPLFSAFYHYQSRNLIANKSPIFDCNNLEILHSPKINTETECIQASKHLRGCAGRDKSSRVNKL